AGVADTDTDAGADGGGPAGVTTGALWVKTIQGGSPGGSWIAAAPDGSIVGAFTTGGELGRRIVLGAGEPNETAVEGRFKPVVLWLRGDDGALLRGVLAVGDQSVSEYATAIAFL